MKILPEKDDADEFIAQVDLLANGILEKHTPECLILIKVNSWFGSRWLGFSGKILGIAGVHRRGVGGVWRRNHLSVPPFVPSRIVSQRRFAAPNYLEVAAGSPLHREVKSSAAILRQIAAIEPGAAVLWYSGNSKLTDHASTMGYIPASGSYTCWYVSWTKHDAWHFEETAEITRQELTSLMGSVEMPRL
jgi:hypothetical protein